MNDNFIIIFKYLFKNAMKGFSGLTDTTNILSELLNYCYNE